MIELQNVSNTDGPQCWEHNTVEHSQLRRLDLGDDGSYGVAPAHCPMAPFPKQQAVRWGDHYARRLHQTNVMIYMLTWKSRKIMVYKYNGIGVDASIISYVQRYTTVSLNPNFKAAPAIN